MKVKDKVGNDLAEGDPIQVKLSDPLVIGKIIKIQDGGMLIPGGQNLAKHPQQEQITAGMVHIILEAAFPFDPRNPIIDGLKVYMPKGRTIDAKIN